jgi:hypothetical protein
MGSIKQLLVGDIEQQSNATVQNDQHSLSFYTITRKEDAHYLRGMLDTLPTGVQCVLVNTVHQAGCKEQTLTVDKREVIDGIEYVFATYNYGSWDFSAARNAALSLCDREWCFWMDTDDRLMTWQHNNILEITKLPQGVGGVMVGCYGYQPPYEENKRGAFYAVPHCRAHRKAVGIQWRGKVHEQIEPQIKDAGFTVIEADIGVYHVGYVVDSATLTAKMGRNVIMLCQQIAEDRTYLPDYYTNVLRNNLNTYLELKGS